EEKYPQPSDNFYVNDFADVMTDSDEQEFLSRAVALEKATTAQVVVAAVEDLGGDEPYEYATELGRQWGIGNEEADNGVLILFARDDREIFIAVGYGLEGALPDSKTGRIIDVYGLEDLRNDNFSKGILSIGKALINEVYIEYGLQPEEGYVNIENIQEEIVDPAEVGVSWAVLIIILIILMLLSRRRGGIIFFPMFHGGGGFHSGGGGFSGGGFSGGGGSFGGGGAGRGF
ncbi:MAG: TPM domain-containing protein, partial [Acutalibacteraceae bacterium]|nr:TPM domain-containing protein [Acutalibacteraceae bacterium]